MRSGELGVTAPRSAEPNQAPSGRSRPGPACPGWASEFLIS